MSQLFFEHKNMIQKDGCFVVDGKITALADICLNKNVLKEFWQGYTFFNSEIEFKETDELVFAIGNTENYKLGDFSYVIAVDKNGILIKANDEKNLVCGFVTLLDCIKYDDKENVVIPCCEIREKARFENRMIHFCIFPDTKIWEVKKFVRLCGALKYSHIIFEFWGMLKYDCLKELSWSHAFSKDEIKPIIKEAHDLGMEVIPMFNHWGHASQSRVMHGKHVVLDQNPRFAYLFDDKGWNWNIKSKKVKNLLKNIRNELAELCGDGEYFHIGCDEAYGFSYDKTETDEVIRYINEVNDDIKAMGRKTIIWADMLLYPYDSYDKDNIYYANAANAEIAEYMIQELDKTIIAADWQYEAKKAPVETAVNLKKSGFEVLICPWDLSLENSEACVNTVKDYGLYGVLHTTWHTLSKGMPVIGKVAELMWQTCVTDGDKVYSAEIAPILRKTYFTDGDYEKSGWAKYEIGVET